MRKVLFVFVLLFVSLLEVTFAQDITFVAKSLARTKYVGPNGALYFDAPLLQSDICISHKSGFYFDLWMSAGFNTNWSNDWDDEFDYTVGWAGKISGVAVDASVCYFDDFKVFSGMYNDAIKSSVKASYSFKTNVKWLTISPYIAYSNYYIPDKETPFSGGNLYSLGSNFEVALTKKLKASQTAELMYDYGAFSSRPGRILISTSMIILELGSHSSWNIAEFSVYLPQTGREMKSQIVYGTGLIFDF